MTEYGLRERLGALLLDVPRTLPRLIGRGRWTRIANRTDSLERAPDGDGVRLPDRWSSDLHVCHVFPSVGRRLMQRALADWPVRFEAPEPAAGGAPRVTFILPHRGVDRVDLLRATCRSVLAQEGVAVECLVIEQSAVREIDALPPGVEHVHLPHPDDPSGWRKAWAFNVGARRARGEILICQDSDIPVPAGYAAEVVRRLSADDLDAAHLQRFLFCLDEDATHRTIEANAVDTVTAPVRVRQNWQGGTLAIRREAFFRLGGYDERFVGWGGEDNEFYDRCSVLRRTTFGYLPFIHLWHAPQAAKEDARRNKNLALLDSLLAVPAEERVAEVRARQGGEG